MQANEPDLAAINSKILADGESLPMVQLKDGSKVQTGTVATMLRNIALYNAGERCAIEDELAAAIPTVAKVGLFELFPPEEWIAGAAKFGVRSGNRTRAQPPGG